jgi:hypothetical protein
MLGLVLALLLSGPTSNRPTANVSAVAVSRPVLVSRVRVLRRPRGAVLRRQARVGRRPIARRRGGR